MLTTRAETRGIANGERVCGGIVTTETRLIEDE